MICELYLIGQPENSGTGIHTIPADNAAKLDFDTSEIAGMQLDGNGGLVISLQDGGQIIIENYEEFVSDETQLEMADGTIINLNALTTSYQTASAIFGQSDTTANLIEKPAENQTQEIALTEGQKYICNFDTDSKPVVEIIDGQMILSFADGSQIILTNYSELAEGELPPELTLADGTVIDDGEILTEVLDIEALADSIENIETAAGEEELTEEELAQVAEELANLETAAGEGSSSNSGYGFNSSPIDQSFDAPDDIGPLGATALKYNAPKFTNENSLIEENSTPTFANPDEFVDETALLLGPIVREGKINVDFGGDTGGTIIINGTTSSSGSISNNILSSHGVPVVITSNGNSYVGTAGGKTIFTFQLEDNGDYTFTQFDSLDHADGTNDNDTLTINFGIKTTDGDGDTTNSSVSVKIADDGPVVLSQIIPTLDETNLGSTGLTHVGRFFADIGQDENPTGAYSTSGQFAVGGSVNGTNLKAGGFPVIITSTSTGYTGTANGVVVFKLNIDPNTGSYGYQQFAAIDHADGNNPNDSITLNFGIKVQDFDGDTANGFITINVLDDAPIANDDGIKILYGGATLTGDVTDNDQIGADEPGAVTKVLFNNVYYNVPATGELTINGTYGVLKIDAHGVYSYEAKQNTKGTDVFSYTLSDRDGDTSQAAIKFKVDDLKPPTVLVNNGVDDVCVKEDGQIAVPVKASYVGGDGDEVLTLTLTGVPSNWTITAPGWAKVGNNFVITLPAGQQNYTGNVTFKPPANSDADLNGLKVTASLHDPDSDQTVTSFDDFKVITDAVSDGVNLAVSSSIALRNGKTKSALDLGISLNDRDGSETVTKIVLEYKGDRDNHFMDFNKGTKIAPNKYEITVVNGDVDAAIKGLELTVNVGGRIGKIFNSGKLHVTVYSGENNLSGMEKDYTDNQSVTTKIINFYARYSPLVLDLDGDGVELTSIYDANVQFDINNDGEKDQVGWVDKDDGLLAIDLNNDGVINNQAELFGDTATVDHGFANLSQYDSNQDGIIDANDERFGDLLIWQDANSDGVSDAGELRNLTDVGIKSINLNATETDYEINNQWISHESTFTRTDGSTATIVDAWFEAANISQENTFSIDNTENLTSFGQEITVVHDEATGIYQGIAGNDIVFNIQIAEDGTHDFNLFSPIDNIGDEGVILHFGEVAISVTAQDVTDLLGEPAEITGDAFLMNAIGEGADTFAAMSQGDGATDFSLVVDHGDNITETIQEFVHHEGTANTPITTENAEIEDNTVFDVASANLPALVEDNGAVI